MFMPLTEYSAYVIAIKIVIISSALFLWLQSVNLFRKNKLLVPGLMNFASYLLLWFGGYTVVEEVYQCKVTLCPYSQIKLYHGFLGIHLFTVEDDGVPCEHEEKPDIMRTLQVRYWGGLIPFLPCKIQLIHKIVDSSRIVEHSRLLPSVPFPMYMDGRVWWGDSPFPRAYQVDFATCDQQNEK